MIYVIYSLLALTEKLVFFQQTVIKFYYIPVIILITLFSILLLKLFVNASLLNHFSLIQKLNKVEK